MNRGSRQPDERRQETIEAVATFSVLMHANERGEHTKVDHAQRALDRLGVVVRFAIRDAGNQPSKGVAHAK